MQDEQETQEEELIDEVLGDNPRAGQLRLMRAALEERRAAFTRDLVDADDAARTRLSRKIKELDRQIAALRQEEAVTEFVETSVRVTVNKAALEDE